MCLSVYVYRFVYILYLCVCTYVWAGLVSLYEFCDKSSTPSTTLPVVISCFSTRVVSYLCEGKCHSVTAWACVAAVLYCVNGSKAGCVRMYTDPFNQLQAGDVHLCLHTSMCH